MDQQASLIELHLEMIKKAIDSTAHDGFPIAMANSIAVKIAFLEICLLMYDDFP